MKKELLSELAFCLDLFKKQGHCAFGGNTKCNECAAPYLLYKMLTGNVLHQEKRLSAKDWEEKLVELKKNL